MLSHICFRAKSYWEYPRELMSHWVESGVLSITPEEIEEHPTYVAEDEEEDEVVGFYSLRIRDGECRVKDLCVLPEMVGTDIRALLFLHACEIAEELGADSVMMVSDDLSRGFYEEMGAEPVGEKVDRSPAGDRLLAILRLNL